MRPIERGPAPRVYTEYGDAIDALSLIVTAALGYGFPSVWQTVFDAYPEVRLALLDAFPGTSKGSFDDLGRPVNRAGGVL